MRHSAHPSYLCTCYAYSETAHWRLLLSEASCVVCTDRTDRTVPSLAITGEMALTLFITKADRFWNTLGIVPVVVSPLGGDSYSRTTDAK